MYFEAYHPPVEQPVAIGTSDYIIIVVAFIVVIVFAVAFCKKIKKKG